MADHGRGGASPAPKTPQRRRPRKLSAAVRERFLGELAATASVPSAAEEIAVSTQALYMLRRRDVAFAAEWRAALLAGYDRIEAALIRKALGLPDHAPVVDAVDGRTLERGEVDVELAILLLDRYRGVVERAGKAVKEFAFRATRDAAEATLLAKLKSYGKRAARGTVAAPANDATSHP